MRRGGRWKRILGAGRGSPRFAAIAGVHGLDLIEYQHGRQGLEILRAVHGSSTGPDADALAGALIQGMDALGAREGDLALAISGFGSAHHILTLPPAEDDLLRPIVRRELLRYYPDLPDPVIDFAPGADVTAAGEGSPKREILVGAVPARLVERLHSRLRDREIRLRHVTVLPEALQQLYRAVDPPETAAVLLLLLETGPLLGCFHSGFLRLFIEPPLDVHGRALRSPAAITEQVERAKLFLRQQFPGTAVERVLLAAPAGEAETISAALEDRLGSKVRLLSEAPAGSMAALGAALDAESAPSLQLLPRALRPAGPSERWTRVLGVAAAVLIALSGLWWAASGIRVARAEASRAAAMEGELRDRMSWIVQTAETLSNRGEHEARVLFLQQTERSQAEVRGIMAAVAAAAGPRVRLDHLALRRADEGWALELAGAAGGESASGAFRAWDALYRGLADRLVVVEAQPGEPEAAAEDSDFTVAVRFDMSFIVRWERDLER